jgi:hypothetical protein
MIPGGAVAMKVGQARDDSAPYRDMIGDD